MARWFSWLGSLLLAASPFIAFGAVTTLIPDPAPRWPGFTAVAAGDPQRLGEVALVDSEGRHVVVFPAESELEVAGEGRVRALTAYRFGGVEAVASGLEGLLGFAVPFYVEARGASVFPSIEDVTSTNVGQRIGQVSELIEAASMGEVPLINARGQWVEQPNYSSYLVDVPSLLSELSERAPEPPTTTPTPTSTAMPSPTPVEELKPEGVSVEVLNAGAPSGSAGRVGGDLQGEGFDVINIGNHAGDRVSATEIYFKEGAGAEAELVASTLDKQIEPRELPEGLSTEAEVLILVGPDAGEL